MYTIHYLDFSSAVGSSYATVSARSFGQPVPTFSSLPAGVRVSIQAYYFPCPRLHCRKQTVCRLINESILRRTWNMEIFSSKEVQFRFGMKIWASSYLIQSVSFTIMVKTNKSTIDSELFPYWSSPHLSGNMRRREWLQSITGVITVPS